MSIFAPGSSAGLSMPPRPRPRSRWLIRALAWGVAGLMLAAVLWRFPLVRLTRLDTTADVASGFDPRAEAARFWSADLEPALAAAADARETLALISRDPNEACRSHGRSVGLSRSCLYLVRGRGTIVEVGPTECRVTLDGGPGEAVVLATGLVFGSAVRDITGTIDPASRTDSRDLAELSNEINHLVHRKVIVPLTAAATVGGTIDFVACGQVQGKLPAGRPWKLLPLRAVVTSAAPPADATPPAVAPDRAAPASPAAVEGNGT